MKSAQNLLLAIFSASAMICGLACWESEPQKDPVSEESSSVTESSDTFVEGIEAEIEAEMEAGPIACWRSVGGTCRQAGASYLCSCWQYCTDFSDNACVNSVATHINGLTCALNTYNTASACFAGCRAWCAAQATCVTQACTANTTCVNNPDGNGRARWSC